MKTPLPHPHTRTHARTHARTHTHFCSYVRCSFLNAENSLKTFFYLIHAMKGLILAAVVT